ncbi:hypothetical protein [Kitasatospora sp. SUK 42]|uniref:hypothetical protein n=1 Tax=Kitasatospora sp. SUK 42 TaxID=1588882 RepID=UPI0018C9F587|nr:hypothetical protein [Kitasatospora sp. SUK 42]MBV2153317.1 hypothetical protein [Kitasatospora sp. SUK 42]
MKINDNEDSGTPAGLAERTSATRARKRRLVVVTLALSLILAGATGFAAYRLTNVGGPGSVCDGAATADQVHDAAGPGRISEYKSGFYDRTGVSTGNTCIATVTSGLFETSKKEVWFTVRPNQEGPREFAAGNARLFSGGSAGAVTPDLAWALLPEGCPKGLRAEVRTHVEGHDEARARLAVAFANGAARNRSCADHVLPAPTSLSARGAETDPDWNNLCGLPGLAPAKDPNAQWAYRQQVTTAFDPIWTCTISGPNKLGLPQILAITTEPRAATATPHPDADPYGRAKLVARGTYAATCQGREVYFTIDGGHEAALAGGRGDYLFSDQKDLVRQFLTAGGKAIGCEPIL